jgi:hypothetical protein
LFRILLVQVAAPSTQTTGRLLADYPNVAELLAVMVLRKIVLTFIDLYPDFDLQRLGSQIFYDFCRPRKGYTEQGEVHSC